jgi:hypothetical protein
MTINEHLSACADYYAGLPSPYTEIFGPVSAKLDLNQIEFCKFLRDTGCRYHDLKKANNVTSKYPAYWTFQASKGGGTFDVDLSLIPLQYQYWSDNNLEYYPTCRVFSFTAWLRRAIYPYQFAAGDRIMIKHIFRYDFIRRQYELGFTVSEISAMIGELDDNNTRGYIDGPVTLSII